MRVTLICHGATAATRHGAFPLDEPLEARSRALASSRPRATSPGLCLTGPALRARETAAVLGLAAVIDPELRDLDAGRWAGRRLADLEADEPEALAAWLSDPEAAPHGGETIAAVITRAAAWLDRRDPETRAVTAVTHPAVIRGAILYALNAPAPSFWRIDVPPLAVVRFVGMPGRWTVRAGDDRGQPPLEPLRRPQ